MLVHEMQPQIARMTPMNALDDVDPHPAPSPERFGAGALPLSQGEGSPKCLG